MGKHNGHGHWLRRIEAAHLAWPEFAQRFNQRSGRNTLMNFSANYPWQAADLPLGTKLLVWVRESGRFFAAMEVIGTLDEGAIACTGHGFKPGDGRHGRVWGKFYRPVRIVGQFTDPASGMTLQEVASRSKIPIRRLQHSMQAIPDSNFDKLFNSIHWDWKASNA